MNDARTARTRFSNTRINLNFPIETSLTSRWDVELKFAVPGLANHDLMAGVSCGRTHHTKTRSYILSASTCSAPSRQKGTTLLWR
jgi:hypothetical protein